MRLFVKIVSAVGPSTNQLPSRGQGSLIDYYTHTHTNTHHRMHYCLLHPEGWKWTDQRVHACVCGCVHIYDCHGCIICSTHYIHCAVNIRKKFCDDNSSLIPNKDSKQSMFFKHTCLIIYFNNISPP